MKKIFLLSFVLFVYLVSSAQDKIITASGDTIQCRIISVFDNYIVYEQQADKKSVSGKTISFSDVAEYFRVSQLSDEKYRSKMPEQPWLFSLSGGGAYLPWLFDYAENDDYKKLNKGLALTANVHYLIRDYVGFGVQYSFFTSGYKTATHTMVDYYYPTYAESNGRERQYVNYVGTSVIFRQFLDKNRKLSLSETFSGGLLLYRIEEQSRIFALYYGYGDYDQFQYISQNTLLTGNTLGATIGISAEYKILPNLSVGVGGNFMYGELSKANIEYKDSFGHKEKVSGQKLGNSLNLSRIDYSLVVRFHL